MGDEALARPFVGGTIYQAFLDASSYHRWHAPISGTVASSPTIISGTYYSKPLVEGFSPDPPETPDPDPDSGKNAQAYCSAVATRGVVFIEVDDPAIGEICVITIGMGEISLVCFTTVLDTLC